MAKFDDAEIAQILEDAADVIRVNGWLQGDLWHGEVWKAGNPVCAVGAICVATEDYNNQARMSDKATLAQRAIEDVLKWGSVPMWNDASNRTAEEVIEKFVEVAKDLRNRSGE